MGTYASLKAGYVFLHLWNLSRCALCQFTHMALEMWAFELSSDNKLESPGPL